MALGKKGKQSKGKDSQIMTMIEIAFKYIPIGVEFGHNGKIYTKTNFNRGYYYREGKIVHRVFRKKTLVNTTSEYFNV